MNESTNPYAAPTAEILARVPRTSDLPYASIMGFLFFFGFMEFTASIGPQSEFIATVCFSSIWLGCWLSSIVSRCIRKPGEVRSARLIGMMVALGAASAITIATGNKPVALAAATLLAGIATFWQHKGRSADRNTNHGAIATPHGD